MAPKRPRSGDVVIVDAARSPFGQSGGQLANWHPASLAGITLNGLLKRTGVNPSGIDSVLLGCSSQVGAQSMNIARNSALSARWPHTVSATTISAQHTSSAQALQLAFAGIKSGLGRMVVAGGVESMSQVPLGMGTIDQRFGQAFGPDTYERFEEAGGIQPPGKLSEIIAQQIGATRRDLETYVVESRRRALTAQKGQHFDSELVRWPTTIDQVTFVDEMAATYDMVALDTLDPCFETEGVTTAAMAAPAADGAAMALLADADTATSVGLDARARIVGTSHMGNDLSGTFSYSADATLKLLDDCSMDLTDIDVFEIQESFASIPLAWSRACGVDVEQCNRDGGALAFGDPIGAGSMKLIVGVLNQLERSNLQYALVVSDGASGFTGATIIERLEQ